MSGNKSRLLQWVMIFWEEFFLINVNNIWDALSSTTQGVEMEIYGIVKTCLKHPHASTHPGKSEAARADGTLCKMSIIGNLNQLRGEDKLLQQKNSPHRQKKRSPCDTIGFKKQTNTHTYTHTHKYMNKGMKRGLEINTTVWPSYRINIKYKQNNLL